MNHFLDIISTTIEDLHSIIKSANEMKKARAEKHLGAPDSIQYLSDRIIALIFEKPSTRTRISFDVGIRQMGGKTMLLSGPEMQLGQGETIADTARVLNKYVDLIIARTFEEENLLEMAEHATVPVINGLTNESHPCQIMADIMTFEEQRGPIVGKKVVWCGDGNNVFTSFAHAARKFNFDLIFTGPEALEPQKSLIRTEPQERGSISIERDPYKAIVGADLVVTDAWLSMHDLQSTKERRYKQLRPYQVNSKLMAKASPNALFMHCLPAHREEEVTSNIMDGENSVVFEEAENRLHVQKAIIRYCLGL